MSSMQKAGRNMMLVASLTVLSKLIAIIRQIVLTNFFGASNISDAYILAQSIPNTLFLLVSSAIGVSFIPVFNQVRRNKGENEADLYTSRMINCVLIISSVIIVFSLIFSNQIIYIFASGFDSQTAMLASKYLRISVFSIYFIGMCGVLSSYLKIKGDFLVPSIIGIALSLVEITTCIIAYYYSDVILAIGITVAAVCQFLLVFFSSIKHGYKHHINLSVRDEWIKKSVLMSLPVMIGLGVDEVNVIVDRTIASGFQTGSISVLNYANTLVSIVHNTISVSIYTVLFTEVSELAVKNERQSMCKRIINALETALLLLIPATVGIIVFSHPIIHVLYERGNFSATSTELTSGAMVFYALYIVPNGIRLISQAYFYAYGRTKLCMIVGFIAVASNIILNLTLSRKIGLNGLALATSIGVLIGSVILFVKLYIENRDFSFKVLIVKSFIIFFNSMVMGIISYLFFQFMMGKISVLLNLILSVCLSLVIYFSMSIITRTLNKDTIMLYLHRG